MRARRRRLTIFAAAALVVSANLGLAAATAPAKKGKRVGGTVRITQAVNAPIADATLDPGTGTAIRAVTNFGANVGKRFKGMRIRDVDATLQVTGTNVPPGIVDSSVNDLGARLTAPNGATVWLFGSFGLTGNLLGPLTFDDETPVIQMTSDDPTGNPVLLFAPYVGRVQPNGPFVSGNNGGLEPLAAMDNGSARGTWRLTMIDYFAGNTNTLVSWGLTARTGKPYLTK